MNRQEILFNLVLLTIIGALAFLIVTEEREQIDTSIPAVSAKSAKPEVETNYNREMAEQKFPKFGKSPLFQAIITPTPSPTPPPPTPPPPPDIKKALSTWKLAGTDTNEAQIEDKAKANDPENQFFTMKVGERRPVQTDKGEVKNVTLKSVDSASDNPNATFIMEGTTVEQVIKMIEDNPAAAPGAPPPQ